MDASNKKERLRAKLVFSCIFAITLSFIGFSGIMAIVTAQKGLETLELRKAEYDAVFKKQVELNFQMDDIFRDLNNLKMKSRTTSEHKHMQQIITQKRVMMESELQGGADDDPKFMAYKGMLSYIKSIQVIMDNIDVEARKRESNMEQLEKCRQKYQELTKNKVKNNDKR